MFILIKLTIINLKPFQGPEEMKFPTKQLYSYNIRSGDEIIIDSKLKHSISANSNAWNHTCEIGTCIRNKISTDLKMLFFNILNCFFFTWTDRVPKTNLTKKILSDWQIIKYCNLHFLACMNIWARLKGFDWCDLTQKQNNFT